MSNSQKISQFSKITSLLDSALITVLSNGQNYTIPFSDFKNALGVTGTIASIGDPLGVPVLNTPVADEYEIRSIESSKGVIASTSPSNGVMMANNFIQSALGTKLIPDLAVDQYRFKTLQSGEGVSITDDGEVLTLSATGVATPSNLRFIASEADFDNQTATTITLTPGIFYQIGANVTTAKNFITQGSVMEGLDIATILTYTGVGSMFTNTNDRFTLSNIVIDCPTAAVFNCIGDNTSNVNHRVNANNVVILNCEKILSSDGAGAQVFSTVQVANMTGPVGISIASTSPAVVLNFSSLAIFGMAAGSTGYDLGTSTSSEIEIANNIMVGDATATAITGLANSGNVTSGNIAAVMGCNFSAFTNQLSGVDVSDVRWSFTGNAGLSNSLSDALIHTSSNALETTINTISVEEKVNAVFVDDDLGRFVSDGTGRLTYIGEVGTRLPIDVTATVLAASGADKQVVLCIAINGVVETATCAQETASSSKAATLATIWQYNFVQNDYIEIFVSNETDTTNLIVTQAIERVN